MRRTGRTPIDDNAVNGNLDNSDAQVIYAQFLTIICYKSDKERYLVAHLCYYSTCRRENKENNKKLHMVSTWKKYLHLPFSCRNFL